MPSGRRDFEYPLRPFLSGDFGKIGNVFRSCRRSVRSGGRFVFERYGASFPPVFQYFHRIGKAFRSERPDSRNPRGLAGVFDRQEDVALAAFGERRRVGDDSSDLPQTPVEGEFAQDGKAFQFAFSEAAFFGDDSQSDGEIERRSRFPDFGGSEVHRDPLLGKGKSRIADRRTNAFPALLHGGVSKSHDRERRKSGGDVGFDGYRVSRQSADGRRKYGFDHKKSAENGYFRATEIDNTGKRAFVKAEKGGLFCPGRRNVVLFLRIP